MELQEVDDSYFEQCSHFRHFSKNTLGRVAEDMQGAGFDHYCKGIECSLEGQ